MWRKVTEIVRFLRKICNSSLILAVLLILVAVSGKYLWGFQHSLTPVFDKV